MIRAALWPDVDPIGRTFRLEEEGSQQAQPFRVIGLARETHYPAIDSSLDGPADRRYAAQLARPRAAAALAMTFASIAVLAAAGRLFSVLSHAVSRRRREFGVRTALGATTRRQIRRVVLLREE